MFSRKISILALLSFIIAGILAFGCSEDSNYDQRAVVYVKVPGRKKPTFEGREVVLGPRVGERYVVVSGLQEGEEVVVRGNFKIDSALQIQAKPSMMNPEGGGGEGHHHHGGGSPRPLPDRSGEEADGRQEGGHSGD